MKIFSLNLGMEMESKALLCLLLVLSFLAFAGVASARTIYVPDDYARIQWAVGNASAGDTIVVRDGIYYENVRVRVKQLTLKSENGPANCIIDSGGRGDVIRLDADGVRIEGFTVRNSGWADAGVFVYSNNSIIINNIISNNYYGIYLWDSDSNQICNNTISSNGDKGIVIWYSDSNQICNNTISSNDDEGIFLDNYSDKNQICNNIISSNGDEGIYLRDSNNNRISNNTISSNDDEGIHLRDSNNNKIYLNNFVDNYDNVYSWGSANIWSSTEKIAYTYKGHEYEGYMGNYWDDYRGSDADGDGIGDTPYSIDGDDKDYYPLMEPFENYFAPENQPPVASFTYTPEHPVVNQTVTFDASSSYDPDGVVVLYEWDFGDGATASGVVVTHAYSAAGNYRVTLTVTNDDGAKNSTSRLITVLPPTPPTVSISTDRYEYAAGDTMLISITLRNPTNEWRNVEFLWRLDLPNYGLHLPIISRSLWLPPLYEKTFTLSWRLPGWRFSFNASWYVALFDESRLISEDRADWRYIPVKEEGMTPEEGMKEVKESIVFNAVLMNAFNSSLL